jgi:error-prone DNA polymerase
MYAELHCLTNFSFLRGASHPHELVERAVKLGYQSLAITDECSVAGVVRAHVAARKQALQLIVGSELRLDDGLRCVLLAMNRTGYAQLCRLITVGRRAAEKGGYCLRRADFFHTDQSLQTAASLLSDCLVLWLPGATPDMTEAIWLATAFPERTWIAVELLTTGHDRRRLQELTALGQQLGMPLTASGDVHMHIRERRILQDTLTAIRLGVPLHQAGFHLHPNGERHLRRIERIAKLYPQALLDETLQIAARCTFNLDELRYEYPQELVPQGETPSSWLKALTEQGARRRWPNGTTPKVAQLIAYELTLIAKLKYEAFFLTVHDLVSYARQRKILCQGRGSAANSVVCFCLGITEVDPERMSVLFERFISQERNEPPDIDVDFEHERREEVIQYIYTKYGRGRAAITATVITYHARSAIRDVGKALGFDLLQVDRLARTMQWWDSGAPDEARVREAGFYIKNAQVVRLLCIVSELLGFPRHLSQHVGGFVIAAERLDSLVPVENATMADRTVIQWDKDDLDALGLIKVDVLALGMLTAIRRSLDLVEQFSGRKLTLANIPAEDPIVYDMICAADTIGVFQIESRAQMSMLPRLRPRSYYDLVIEVAIVRPGPIQGDMVHPYLRRRTGAEPVTYPSPKVRQILKRTLGIPIFQEQVMQLAMVAAGFTASEADQLRRAMAAWKRKGGLEPFQAKLTSGMLERGYSQQFAEQICNQIKGFGEYGFPESHAASFALLVYVSAWLKCHQPAAFTTALLNSQPMGFYAPAQLVQDAQRHGVEVRPVDVQSSQWECTLEKTLLGHAAIRLGLCMVRGFGQAAAQRLITARVQAPDASVQALAERAQLDNRDLNALAAAGAFVAAGNRHRAVWNVSGVEAPLPLFPDLHIAEGVPLLTAPTEGKDIVADYRSVGLTLKRHPLALLRERLQRERMVSAAELRELASGLTVRTAGLVIGRQRPHSANGVTFVTLEDETGCINLIVWRSVAEQQRRALLQSRLLQVVGTLQREGDVQHLIVQRLIDRTRLLGQLLVKSRDFH